MSWKKNCLPLLTILYFSLNFYRVRCDACVRIVFLISPFSFESSFGKLTRLCFDFLSHAERKFPRTNTRKQEKKGNKSVNIVDRLHIVESK